jgi:hypothetical protein
MEKQKMKLKDHSLLIIVISLCLIITTLLPLASYLCFENILNSKTQSYNSILSSAQEENVRLKQEITNLTQQLGIAEDPLMSKPYFVTNLGWYLHNSSDKISSMANKFTIYGAVLNIGATDAQNCSLIIRFYNNETLLQTSDISIGPINHWSEIELAPRDIPCGVADSVTKINVETSGANVP